MVMCEQTHRSLSPPFVMYFCSWAGRLAMPGLLQRSVGHTTGGSPDAELRRMPDAINSRQKRPRVYCRCEPSPGYSASTCLFVPAPWDGAASRQSGHRVDQFGNKLTDYAGSAIRFCGDENGAFRLTGSIPHVGI
jgi:hypothetical protein